MATPYYIIYDSFLRKVSDYNLLDLELEDRELLLKSYLDDSCANFYTCKKDLSDRGENQFNETLSTEEINIIATGMLVEWLTPKLLLNENMENNLSPKDINIFSSANLLKEVRETYGFIQKKFDSMVNNYSYKYGNIDTLKNKEGGTL